jgi:hypothetical protein
MAPDVLLRKLTYLRQLLKDLSPYKEASLAEVEAEHYKLERLLELLVMAASLSPFLPIIKRNNGLIGAGQHSGSRL